LIRTVDLETTLEGRTIVIAMFAGARHPIGGAACTLVAELLRVDVAALLAANTEFTGDATQLARATIARSDGAWVNIVGVGFGREAALTSDSVRSAAMAVARAYPSGDLINALALEVEDVPAAVRATVEGTRLGDYRYQRVYRDVDLSAEVHVVVAEKIPLEELDNAVELGVVFADATNWARQLVETPGNQLGPAEFAQAIQMRAKRLAPTTLDVSVWTLADLESRGFGATLAVGRGSSRPPLVVELTSRAGGTPIALAGKGITFDSGGINIKKDGSELAWMKSDMAAAAAVAAAVIAVASMGSTAPFQAILPIAENMPGGDALRPGDVVFHPDGRSTEVTDTDCEGRLVLADAIAWLASRTPRSIIDVGTLTDSGGVGTSLWGCWTNSDDLAREVVDAGTAAGDPGWILPLVASYRSLLKSMVADSVNVSVDSPDSAQLAATYLQPFAGEIPWVHIDNGAGAYLESDAAEWPKGATGTPTRALIEFLLNARSRE